MGVTRRDMLIGAGGLASALVLGAPLMNAVGEGQAVAAQPAAPRLKVIVAGGHPGDPEYGCGGTVARLTGLGHQVVLLYLNNGAWPPTGASVRIAEATRACEILKARAAYARQENGKAVVDNAHYEEYAGIIEAEKPDAILTQWPIDNHRDHRAFTMLTYDSQKRFSDVPAKSCLRDCYQSREPEQGKLSKTTFAGTSPSRARSLLRTPLVFKESE
jgi:N-acetylglucosamine malate deacetylase 1